MKKQFVKIAREIIKTKRAPKAADFDVHLCFDNALNRCMLSGVEQIAEEVPIQPVAGD